MGIVFAIWILNGPNADPLFSGFFLVRIIAGNPDFSGRRIITQAQAVVHHNAAAKAGANGDPQHIFILFGDVVLFHVIIHFGEQAAHGLTICEQVTVVVDEYGQVKFFFQHRSQRYATTEAGQVFQVAYHARGIIRRPRKGKAYGIGCAVYLWFNFLKPADYIVQAAVQVFTTGRQGHWFHKFFTALQGRKNKIRAPGVQRHYDPFIVENIHRILDKLNSSVA